MPYKIKYSNELKHHGILGMKWGKRNGPPYPLDYNDHSAEQKKLNPKSALNNYSSNNLKKGQTTGDYKKALKEAKKESRKAYNETYDAARKIPTFAITKRGKEKKAQREEDYSKKFDKMTKAFENEEKAKKAYKESKKKDKQNRKDELNKALKEYNKKVDKAGVSSEKADNYWFDVVEKNREALGKTELGRTLNAARGKSKEAKEYLKSYNEWEKLENIAEKDWAEASNAYIKTGETYINRIFNNMSYDLNKNK